MLVGMQMRATAMVRTNSDWLERRQIGTAAFREYAPQV